MTNMILTLINWVSALLLGSYLPMTDINHYISHKGLCAGCMSSVSSECQGAEWRGVCTGKAKRMSGAFHFFALRKLFLNWKLTMCALSLVSEFLGWTYLYSPKAEDLKCWQPGLAGFLFFSSPNTSARIQTQTPTCSSHPLSHLPTPSHGFHLTYQFNCPYYFLFQKMYIPSYLVFHFHYASRKILMLICLVLKCIQGVNPEY